MIRGTTANFRFKLPYEVEQVQTVMITFWQTNNTGTISAPLPIVKDLLSCSITDNPYELSVTLSPHETARFSSQLKMQVQLEGVTFEGVKFGNEPEMFNVYPNKNISPDLPDDPIMPPDLDGEFIVLDGGNIEEDML